MPRRLTRSEIEIWKKLRKEEGLTYEEIGKQRGWSRQVVARELGKLEPKKSTELPAIPASDLLSFINLAGGITQRKCLRKGKEGYCQEMEFPASDWTIADFKRIFPEFVVVERKDGSYLRPKAPNWFCYICGRRMETDTKIARLKNSLGETRSEGYKVREELLVKIDKTGADIQRGLLERINKIESELQDVKHKSEEPIEAARQMRIFGSAIREICFQQHGRCEIGTPRLWSLFGEKLPSPYMCALCLAPLRRR